jgi:FAD/FMN-containing dehydrogenase
VEIVTADSRLLLLNSCTNTDLFWAVRGGGGGSWGVITSLTYKANEPPTEKYQVSNIIKSKERACKRAGVDCAKELVRAMVDWIH